MSLKSRRARQIIPAQDVDVGKLMEKFGMDSDSEESVDEDFSPTNADSGESGDSNDSGSSSEDNSSSDDSAGDKKVVKTPTAAPQSSSSNVPVQQQKKPDQTPQEQQQKQQQKQQQQSPQLVQFHQLSSEIQQLVLKQLQQQSTQGQQQLTKPDQQLLKQQLLLSKQPLLLPKQQLPKQQSSKQQSPKQQSPKQQLPKQQLPKQQPPNQQPPNQQPQHLSTQKLPKQQLSVDQLSQQLLQQLIQKQTQGQPQGVPVQFHQLPSNAQDVLRKQMHKDELLKLQQSKAKFIVISSSQDKSKTPQASTLPSSSKQSSAIQPTQLSTKQMPVPPTQQEVKQPTVGEVVSAIKPQQPLVAPKKEDLLEKQKQQQKKQQQQKQEKQQLKPLPEQQQQQKQQQQQEQQQQQQQMDVEPSAASVTKEADVVEATTSSMKEVDLMLCFVCLEESKAAGEDMAQCDRCGITVHEGCYGVPEKSDDEDDARSDLSDEITTPWFCDSCRAGMEQPSCELCPSTNGVFKQTIHGSWVHMVCSLYTPGVEYVEPSLLAGVSLDQVPANKWGARVCQLCEDESYSHTGVCISCDAGLCKSYFHVTCAQRHGLLCEEEENSEDEEDEVEVADPYYAYCKQHCNKDVARRKRRNWLALLSRQKQFSSNQLDNRAKSALMDQRSEYFDLREKMRLYYKPHEQSIKQERWLHHHPKACQQLLKKAELLGHTNDTVTAATGGRGKITPSLSCDFVNYYIERNGRIKNQQELNDKLVLTNQLLDEDCDQLQEEVSSYELILDSHTSESNTLQEQLLHLYKCLQTGCKKIALPKFITAVDNKENTKDEKTAKKCDECASSDDQHLIITCDTCDRHYHIGCLDPPLTKIPKKTAKYGWQCEACCCDSEDDLKPTKAPDWVNSSRSGRAINKPYNYQQSEDQQKTKKRKR